MSVFTGALGRARPSLWPNKMPSLDYQMIEIYVFFHRVLQYSVWKKVFACAKLRNSRQ